MMGLAGANVMCAKSLLSPTKRAAGGEGLSTSTALFILGQVVHVSELV